jgi:hypothetical protein
VYPFFFRFLIKLELSGQIFKNFSNFKLRENPSSASRTVSCGRTDRQTDVTELIVAFRSFTKAHNKLHFLWFRAQAYPNAVPNLEFNLRHIRGKRDYLLRTGNMDRNDL